MGPVHVMDPVHVNTANTMGRACRALAGTLSLAVVLAACGDQSGSQVATSDPVEIQRINAEIQQQMLTASTDHVFISVGAGETAVHVDLRADARAVADDLLDRYGDKVHVTLGRFPYPPGAVADIPNEPCNTLGSPDAELMGVDVAVALDDDTIVSGADGSGTVTLTNSGPGSVRFDYGSGLLVGVVVRPGTDAVVAEYVGGMTANLVGVPLEPGVPVPIHMVFSTAACEQSDGYALEPGGYELLVTKALSVAGVNTPLSAEGTAFDVVSASA